ncbi:histone chaperone NAP1 NDAI_0B05290 [Naumovozyma dairenensis CBS 421]|uniref:Nucleosome assembly protein n=1 Tax=Naumovozyma dairenensis (strain ATCC 10597 / BCRC 20456 / CBS 421 / NBRC 0211 / NRRL Y-12639) TaxID=1071378 RepID=G0W701_NAUDC|nr:hypothetical protein NDAI_0B05290 [Naumovozyma dairenensis CBS 421]CCD23562.1 hypothetical protein NDAI_0B05290 [Naumovozyma dairenensis CBS 421]
MSAPIKTNPKSSMKIDNAPTPHNTPASVLGTSYLKNGNPVKHQKTIDEDAEAEATAKSLLANEPLLLQSIQDKLGTLIGQDSGYVENLPMVVKERMFALKKLQNDLFQMEKDFQIEMFELENKYLNKYKPLFERRSNIISGVEQPSKEEISKGKEMILEENEDFVNEEEEEEGEEKKENQNIKGIPSFWLTALENLPNVSDKITERDAAVLEYLLDISMEYLTEGKPGFKLIFKFSKENPFFTDKELVKTYYYQNELGYSGDFIYDHAEGQEINWKDSESNVTVNVETRKQRNKVTKQVRTIEKLTPTESFFNFFDPPKMPEHDHAEGEECNHDHDHGNDEYDADDDELDNLEDRLGLDYLIGEQLKDKLIPRAIDWFTGAALEFEYAEEEEEEEEEDDDEDDDDDDEDADEDEEDDFANTANKSEQAPECKQS